MKVCAWCDKELQVDAFILHQCLSESELRGKIVPCCGDCGQELQVNKDTTLATLGEGHKCEREGVR